jgi:hypothetical protein
MFGLKAKMKHQEIAFIVDILKRSTDRKIDLTPILYTTLETIKGDHALAKLVHRFFISDIRLSMHRNYISSHERDSSTWNAEVSHSR